MKNKFKFKKDNSNFLINSESEKKFFEEEEKNEKIQREKRIKEINKIKKQEQDSFDFDTETVIGITNKNNAIKTEAKKQAMTRKQIKLQKRRKKIKIILKIFTFLILISSSITFALVSPIFAISKIEVTENNEVSSDSIISLSGLSTGQNIFKFLKKDVEKSIKENAYIESATITRKLPGTIKISVKERERKFSIQFLNGYAYIDEQGYILEISQDKLNLPVIIGVTTSEENIVPKNRLEIQDLKKLEVVINIMASAQKNNFREKVTSIDISDENEYSIYLEEEQKTVYLGDGSNLKDKMIWVPEIIEKEKGKAGEIFVNGDFNNKFRAYFRERV